MKIEEAIALWLEVKRKKWKSKAVGAHVLHLSKGWVTAWGGWELEQITAENVLDWFKFRADGKRSAVAVNYERMWLRQLFKYAIRAGWVQRDPTYLWERLPYTPKKLYLPLSHENEKALLIAGARIRWFSKFVVLGVCTGLRERTLREARWAWITENWWLLCPPGSVKNGEAHSVPLSTRARKILGPRRKVGRLIPGLPPPSQVTKVFKQLAEMAGIYPVPTPHDLIKTFCWRNRAAGCSLEDTMELRGVKTPGIIMKHYWGKLPVERAESMVEKL